MNILSMRKFRWLLLAALICAGDFAFAQVATVFELSGSAQAIPNAGAPRALRKGDSLNQGETIATADASSIILRFEDGQVVALSAKSRFTIAAYTYNKAEPAKSSVLLSLLQGGMRAITGLIGKRDPALVTYKAANATVGIRGTDVIIATDGVSVAVTVSEGAIVFSFGGQTVSIPVGQGALTTASGTIQSAPASQIIAAIQAQGTVASAALAAVLVSVSSPAIEAAVNRALQSGSAGNSTSRDTAPPPTPSATGNTGSSGSGGAGGGSASGR